jgi:hypothetical protein
MLGLHAEVGADWDDVSDRFKEGAVRAGVECPPGALAMPLVDLFLEALSRRECLLDFWCSLRDEVS